LIVSLLIYILFKMYKIVRKEESKSPAYIFTVSLFSAYAGYFLINGIFENKPLEILYLLFFMYLLIPQEKNR